MPIDAWLHGGRVLMAGYVYAYAVCFTDHQSDQLHYIKSWHIFFHFFFNFFHFYPRGCPEDIFRWEGDSRAHRSTGERIFGVNPLAQVVIMSRSVTVHVDGVADPGTLAFLERIVRAGQVFPMRAR